MCGIAGIMTAKTGRLDLRSLAEQMQGTLTHRGSDDRGLFISNGGNCGLAHTRLSILDLSSAGHQPMGLGGLGEIRNSKFEIRNDLRARYWITYNGEIYNYLQLRKELGAWSGEQGASSTEQGAWSKERPWQSETDTEVILRAYERWGRECVSHLRGMFGFAIWDQQKQELFLARDPLGIKPLYYYQTDGLFVFASEVRALLASGLVPRKLSLDGLASYLQFGSVQDPLTIIDGKAQ
jgi:asparagine synthase (glutamine-hydrolysing)